VANEAGDVRAEGDVVKVGFFTVYKGDVSHYVLADAMVESVRRAMPDVPVVQFTDEESPAVYGVDDVRRQRTLPMAMLRMAHHAACEGDWLFLDTDCIVNRDVRDVFQDSFDVAVADRNWTHIPMTIELQAFNAKMPYNIGIMFSRSPQFWQAVLQRLLTLPKEQQEWMGDQHAACAIFAEGQFHVKTLPGMTYHYPPSSADDTGTEAAIVHYKGPRKAWMLERYARVMA
jgi:hypothetical protein